ncbi:type VI immunity family protein [Rhizobium leguminosarum]|uniref:type VI immunity family protein n=1 Tax=Rhizobium leguminosarum TaxID=384 RepID=UPI0013BF82D6|nr:type VI immunity family protein [Rhizobium leguminosarum]MBY5326120.1 DUF3396 domain-containing protein [Rhizobium leguminosarum]NEH55872.1 DUF3396 domain-containing protein [Rhizobium leguminosarum]
MSDAMHLTKELAAQIDGFSFANGHGFVETRIGFAVELFFLGGSESRTRLILCDMLRQYHALFTDALSHFLKLNTSRLTKITGSDYLDYYENIARKLSSTEPMDAMVFGYPGKKVVDEPTPLSISFKCAGPDPMSPLGRSMICAYFPASFVAERGYGILLDLTKRWASSVELLHGGAGYSLLFEHGVFAGSNTVAETVLPPLKRFPGLDFSDPLHFEVESDLGDGRQIKSINWLTVINNEIVGKLGGQGALAKELGETCPIHGINGGLIIQAGSEPQLGDVNRGLVLDDYRRVAKVLEPVLFKDYRRGLFVLPAPYDKIEETRRWLRRYE